MYGIINYSFVITITGRPWRSKSQKLCSITLGLGAHKIVVPGPVNFSDGSDTDRHFIFIAQANRSIYILPPLSESKRNCKKKSRIKRKKFMREMTVDVTYS